MLNDTYFKIIKQTITSCNASSSWMMLTACHVKSTLDLRADLPVQPGVYGD